MTQVIIRFNGRNRAVDLHPFDTPATILERLASQLYLSHCSDVKPHNDGRAGQNMSQLCSNHRLSSLLRIVHQGRTLPLDTPLLSSTTTDIHSLDILPRLLGGGGDGGSTGAESRSTYLEMYAGKKHAKVNPEEERLARWTNCNLSGLPLQPPCVCDSLGFLYNKEAVVSALLAKTLPQSLSYITGLKALSDVKLEIPPDDDGTSRVRFTCPVTGLEANGKVKFVAIKPSGHVFSDKAVIELKSIVEEMVGGPWSPGDVIVINPSGEEVEVRRNELLAQIAAKKKSKNDKKRRDDGVDDNNKKRLKSEQHMPSNTIPVPAGATPEVWNSLFGNGKKKNSSTHDDYMTRGTGVRR